MARPSSPLARQALRGKPDARPPAPARAARA